ncbi:MAG: AraC family transcriptional regulator [Paludibacteraceae bacterium]|nr:AraC family transcriptional regulator [Paludibacteraceae bacterium]
MQNIPLLDCPVDYLVGDATGSLMNEYCRFPCKIKCGVYAFMVRGSAKATINITKYSFQAGDALWLESGSFLLIDEFSDDSLVYYLLFSSSFLEKNTHRMRLQFNTIDFSSPVIHTSPERSALISNGFKLLMQAVNCEPPALNNDIMMHIYNILLIYFINHAKEEDTFVSKPQDRKTEIYHEYSKLVLKHYHEWHHVAQYADALRITLPHLCSSIKAASGKTAGELINEAILTDAKAQLKITSAQIKEIAISLGFENVAFFNRFFKAHTGQTPKEYRFRE